MALFQVATLEGIYGSLPAGHSIATFIPQYIGSPLGGPDAQWLVYKPRLANSDLSSVTPSALNLCSFS